MSANQLNAIIYCRVSTKNQEGFEHVSLDAQEDACRAWCAANGFDVIGVHKEVGSARNMLRNLKSLKTIVNTLLNAQTHLVVYNVSRFTRNLFHGVGFLQTIMKKKSQIHSVMEAADYSNYSGQHIINTAMCFHANESNHMSERSKRMVEFLRREGHHIGNAPFGKMAYRTQTNLRKIKNNPAEQRIIRTIERMSASTNAATIAEYLNRRAMYKRGREWTTPMVKRIIATSTRRMRMDEVAEAL